MARRVFFSFHYDNDVTRASVVRNSWVTKPDRQTAGYIDHSDFEKLKQRGSAAVKAWIDDQLIGSSATVVLIGSETLERPFVKYELEQSVKRGNAILGVYIDNIRDFHGRTSSRGNIYNVEIGTTASGNTVYFSSFPMYDWVNDNGYANLGTWIENAITNQK
jgi:hypothetical protein